MPKSAYGSIRKTRSGTYQVRVSVRGPPGRHRRL